MKENYFYQENYQEKIITATNRLRHYYSQLFSRQPQNRHQPPRRKNPRIPIISVPTKLLDCIHMAQTATSSINAGTISPT